MSFFELSDGKKAEQKTVFETESGGFQPIPAGTILLAMVTEAKWDQYEGDEYISLRWDVVGKEYTNRVIYQKIKVQDADPKKRDRAIMMLMAIDANAGGMLYKSNESPTNDSLQHLCNKQIGISVDVWEMNDKSGNYITMVSDAKSAGDMLKERGGNPKATPAPVKKAEAKVELDISDEELPF